MKMFLDKQFKPLIYVILLLYIFVNVCYGRYIAHHPVFNEANIYRQQFSNFYGTPQQFQSTLFSPPGTFYDKRKGILRTFPGGGIPILVDYYKRCSGNYVGIKAHPEQNQYYYVCKPDCVVFGKCQNLQTFDKKSNQCVPYSLLDFMPSCTKEGRFPIYTDCKIYYKCETDLIPKIYSCPESMIFSPLQSKCIPGKQCAPTQISVDSAHIPENCKHKFPPCLQDGLFRSPSDCSLFYNCTMQTNGIYLQTRLRCDEGKFFDQIKGKCLPQHQVPCDCIQVAELVYPKIPQTPFLPPCLYPPYYSSDSLEDNEYPTEGSILLEDDEENNSTSEEITPTVITDNSQHIGVLTNEQQPQQQREQEQVNQETQDQQQQQQQQQQQISSEESQSSISSENQMLTSSENISPDRLASDNVTPGALTLTESSSLSQIQETITTEKPALILALTTTDNIIENDGSNSPEQSENERELKVTDKSRETPTMMTSVGITEETMPPSDDYDAHTETTTTVAIMQHTATTTETIAEQTTKVAHEELDEDETAVKSLDVELGFTDDDNNNKDNETTETSMRIFSGSEMPILENTKETDLTSQNVQISDNPTKQSEIVTKHENVDESAQEITTDTNTEPEGKQTTHSTITITEENHIANLLHNIRNAQTLSTLVNMNSDSPTGFLKPTLNQSIQTEENTTENVIVNATTTNTHNISNNDNTKFSSGEESGEEYWDNISDYPSGFENTFKNIEELPSTTIQTQLETSTSQPKEIATEETTKESSNTLDEIEPREETKTEPFLTKEQANEMTSTEQKAHEVTTIESPHHQTIETSEETTFTSEGGSPKPVSLSTSETTSLKNKANLSVTEDEVPETFEETEISSTEPSKHLVNEEESTTQDSLSSESTSNSSSTEEHQSNEIKLHTEENSISSQSESTSTERQSFAESTIKEDEVEDTIDTSKQLSDVSENGNDEENFTLENSTMQTSTNAKVTPEQNIQQTHHTVSGITTDLISEDTTTLETLIETTTKTANENVENDEPDDHEEVEVLNDVVDLEDEVLGEIHSNEFLPIDEKSFNAGTATEANKFAFETKTEFEVISHVSKDFQILNRNHEESEIDQIISKSNVNEHSAQIIEKSTDNKSEENKSINANATSENKSEELEVELLSDIVNITKISENSTKETATIPSTTISPNTIKTEIGNISDILTNNLITENSTTDSTNSIGLELFDEDSKNLHFTRSITDSPSSTKDSTTEKMFNGISTTLQTTFHISTTEMALTEIASTEIAPTEIASTSTKAPIEISKNEISSEIVHVEKATLVQLTTDNNSAVSTEPSNEEENGENNWEFNETPISMTNEPLQINTKESQKSTTTTDSIAHSTFHTRIEEVTSTSSSRTIFSQQTNSVETDDALKHVQVKQILNVETETPESIHHVEIISTNKSIDNLTPETTLFTHKISPVSTIRNNISDLTTPTMTQQNTNTHEINKSNNIDIIFNNGSQIIQEPNPVIISNSSTVIRNLKDIPQLELKVFGDLDLHIVYCPKDCMANHNHTFAPVGSDKNRVVQMKWNTRASNKTLSLETGPYTT